MMGVQLTHPISVVAMLVVLVLMLALLVGWRKQKRRMAEATSIEIRPRIVSGRRPIIRFACEAIALVAMLVALARPQSGTREEKIHVRSRDILIAVDISKSMFAQDVEPSRVVFARHKIEDLMRLAPGHRIGLIPFSGTAFLQCPPTLDHDAVRMFLDLLDPEQISSTGGSRLDEAIRVGVESFVRTRPANSGAPAGVVLLMTDGENMNRTTSEAAARQAAAQQVKLFALTIGSRDGAPIPVATGGFIKDRSGKTVVSRPDFEFMQSLTALTGGKAFRSAVGDDDLQQFLAIVGDAGVSDHEEVRLVGEERFGDLLKLALLFLVVESLIFAFPTRAIHLIILSIASFGIGPQLRAEAAEDRPISGRTAYEAGDFEGAQKAFGASGEQDWRNRYNEGVAAYRNGQWDKANQAFDEVLQKGPSEARAKSWFNIGNGRFRKGDRTGAKDAFERSLGFDSDFKEARENLEALKKQQEQKQDQKQDQKQEQQQDQKNDDQSKRGQEQKSSDQQQQKPNDQQQKQKDENSQNSPEKSGKAGKDDKKDEKEGKALEPVELGRKQSERLLDGIDDRGDPRLYQVVPQNKDAKEGDENDKDW